MRTREVRWLAAAGVFALALAGGRAGAGNDPVVTLGPLLRVQTLTEQAAMCPFESEPTVTWTRAGTWVAYNDDSGCPLIGTSLRLTGVQLLSPDGHRRQIALPTLPQSGFYEGDPGLTPDPSGDGSVLLSSLVAVGGTTVAVARLHPDGQSELLPSPSVGGSEDKEFVAADSSPRSRYRGHVYLVWDDFTTTPQVTLRTFDRGQWRSALRLHLGAGKPDVAVSADGTVAVAYETDTGVAVQVSRDGGRTFARPVDALVGGPPGRTDPSCPLRPTIGARQRALKSPRVAYDRAGRLHVVASLGPVAGPVGTPGPVGAVTGGEGTVVHSVSADGVSFRPQDAVAPGSGQVQWAPAVAATPSGGVAVSFLQTSGSQLDSFEARMAVYAPRAGRAGAALALSEAAGPLPPATEAVGNSNCYGIGDYTGLAPNGPGVVAVWPTTVGVATSYLDSDIALRTARIRG